MNKVHKRKIELNFDLIEELFKTGGTVRSIGDFFKCSKSLVYVRITETSALKKRFKKYLKYNKKVRHIRGGQATKDKYKKLSKVLSKG